MKDEGFIGPNLRHCRSCFAAERAQQLLAGTEYVSARATVQHAERGRLPAGALELLQGVDPVQDVRVREVRGLFRPGGVRGARERVSLRQQGGRQSDALGLSPALTLDEQPAGPRLNR